MKIVVLGGTGFLGKALCDALGAAGHKTISVARSHEADVQMDLRMENGVRALLSSEQPDFVINMASAGLSSVHQRTLFDDLIAIDVRLPLIVLDWATHVERRTKFLQVSSALHQMPIESVYARAKRDSRDALCAALGLSERADLEVCIVDIHNCYGPGQPRGRFIPDAIDTLARGEKLLIRHPARQRDFVYLPDVVASLLMLVSDPDSCRTTVEIGTGHAVSVAEVGRVIARDMGLDPSDCLVVQDDATVSDRVVATQIGGTFGLCNTKLVDGIRQMRMIVG